MIDIQVLSDTFDATLYPTPDLTENIASLVKINIRAVFTASAVYRIFDEFDAEDITRNDDGTFTVDTKMPLDEWLHGCFLSYGENVRIIEPLSLRQELQKKIEAMQKNYL